MFFLKDFKKIDNLIFLFLFLIIFISSIDIKRQFITEIYTEYDDVGVITLHKGVVGNKEINILEKKITLNQTKLKDLNNSLLFPAYIVYGWTYAPGQYLVVPFLNLKNKNYEDKIFNVRIISLISTILNSLLILFISIKYFNVNKWLSLLIFCIFSFSYNSNIYANHMSPYATYSLCSTLGAYICIQGLKSKNYLKYYTINSMLIYFSYINILFFLAFIFIEFRMHRLKKTLLNLITDKKKYLIINFLLLIPIVSIILIKLIIFNAGDRGVYVDENLNYFFLLKRIAEQFSLSINSLHTGFIPVFFESINFILILFIIICGIFYSYKKLNLNNKIILEIFVLYFVLWIFLYCFKKLPLDQTRHSLIYFPIYLFCLVLIFKNIKYSNIISVIIILTLLIPGIKNNKKILESKKSNFEYDLILNTQIKNIYTFSDTLSPFIYFDQNYKIFNLDLNSYRKNFKQENLPDKIILVSQNQSLEERSNYDTFFKNFIDFYNIDILKENFSSTYMPFNNYKDHSTQNGFYLYKLDKKISIY